MDRNDILRISGFSKEFIEAIEKHEKLIPDNDYYEAIGSDLDGQFIISDITDKLIVNRLNDNYSTSAHIRNT
jgi:hypothetical protein